MTRIIKLPLSAFIYFSLTACATATQAAPGQNTPTEPVVSVQLTQAEKFTAWKTDFIARAVEKGYDEVMVRRLIEPAEISEKALDRDRDQPEFTKPIWSYVDNAANATRLNNGRTKLAEESAVFNAVEGRYFVPREYLAAIWGLESAYGKIQGDYDVISALATFAHDGRRSSFGEQQLFAILDIVRDGHVRPDQLTGSWAGAMGMMQFIPSTFRDYAVDFNNDGNKDLWNSSQDAMGSAAHYLSRHGWRWREPVFTEVTLPADFDYGLSDGSKKTVNEWTALGVAPITGQRWSAEAGFLDAKLLVPAGHKRSEIPDF